MPFYRSWRLHCWETRLSHQLAFRVELESVEELAPGRVVFSGLRIKHPETHETLAEASRVEAERYRRQWLVHAEAPEVQGQLLAAGWKVFHDAFVCLPRAASSEAHLRCQRLKIRGSLEPFVLHDVSVKFATRSDSTYLWTEFQSSPVSDSPVLENDQTGSVRSETSSQDLQVSQPQQPTRVSIVRKHRKPAPSTQVSFQALPNAAIPCSLLKLLCPSVEQFGTNSAAFGSLRLELAGDGQSWRAVVGRQSSADTDATELQGLAFINVDFESMLWNAPADVTGAGWLRLDQAILTNNGIELLRGAAELRSGRVSTETLRRANQLIGLALAPELLGPTPPDTAFLAAYFSFGVDAVSGGLDLEAVLQGSGGTLARRQLSAGSIPLERIVALLDRNSPGSDPKLVPVTRLGRMANQWLPLDPKVIQQAKRTARLD